MGKQPVDKEHHNDTESPIRPRRTSRKDGSAISVPKDNISVEEKQSNKGIEKEIEDTVVEISNVVSKSNKLKPSESKTHGDNKESKTAGKLGKIEETVKNKNTKNSTSVGKEKEELGILSVNKSPKDELGPNKKIFKRTKDDKESQKEVDLKKEK